MVFPRRTNVTAEEITKKSFFLSYAINGQDPVSWLERLQLQLKPLEKRYDLDVWDDGKIQTGQNWRKEIEKTLEHAVAAILLVGLAFLASKFR
jgi:hypothetical protein